MKVIIKHSVVEKKRVYGNLCQLIFTVMRPVSIATNWQLSKFVFFSDRLGWIQMMCLTIVRVAVVNVLLGNISKVRLNEQYF